MARVKALLSIDHNGTKKKGDVFEVSDKIADELLRRGLVARLKDGALQGESVSTPAQEGSPKPATKTVRRAAPKPAAAKE